MKIVCAWCEKIIGSKEPESNTSTSHGICPDCYERCLWGFKDINKPVLSPLPPVIESTPVPTPGYIPGAFVIQSRTDVDFFLQLTPHTVRKWQWAIQGEGYTSPTFFVTRAEAEGKITEFRLTGAIVVETPYNLRLYAAMDAAEASGVDATEFGAYLASAGNPVNLDDKHRENMRTRAINFIRSLPFGDEILKHENITF